MAEDSKRPQALPAPPPNAPLSAPNGPQAMPKPPAPAEIPAPLGPLYTRLAADGKQLLTVYHELSGYAESLGIPSGVVRSVMLSAYISLNQRGSGRAATVIKTLYQRCTDDDQHLSYRFHRRSPIRRYVPV